MPELFIQNFAAVLNKNKTASNALEKSSKRQPSAGLPDLSVQTREKENNNNPLADESIEELEIDINSPTKLSNTEINVI